MTADELQALGLWDPAAPDADERLALLTYVASLGATPEELREYADDLSGLAYVCVMRGRGPRLVRAELAERVGVSEAIVSEVTRAAGFADPGPDDAIYGPGWIDVLQTVRAAEAVFGHEAVIDLARVIGAALAKIADATASAFVVHVGAAQESPLIRARANVDSSALFPGLIRTMDVLLRQHMIAARRMPDSVSPDGWTMRLTIGFVDLVGSTALAQELTVRELNAVLTRFEATAAEIVHGAGGRLVKLIGDEVMFAFADPLAACETTLRLVEELPRHDALPPARGGLAMGEVLSRDGDHYGPVVNMAARLVQLARPGTALVTRELAQQLSPAYRAVEIPARRLRGFDGRQRIYALRRAVAPASTHEPY
jgi:adenylate cyclase